MPKQKLRKVQNRINPARLRTALFDAQRARGAASIRVKQANRAVLLALLANDRDAALAAKEREYVAICERKRCADLVSKLSAEMTERKVTPLAPDLHWVEQVLPGVLRAVCNAIANGERAAA